MAAEQGGKQQDTIDMVDQTKRPYRQGVYEDPTGIRVALSRMLLNPAESLLMGCHRYIYLGHY
jgi:hypothetical protein